MALEVQTKEAPQISLAEFQDLYRSAEVAPGDDEALLAQADLLARLCRNRTFLCEELIGRLEALWDGDFQASATSQTVNLGSLGNGHYLRMVFWPSRADEFFERCDNSVFYYGRPHDHNFSFLTVGYDGPGYESDYYRVDGPTDDWFPGKTIELVPTGRKRLEQGKVMFYRRHLDVHSQLPPEANSLSINIMGSATAGPGNTQFVFSPKADSVQQVMQSRFNPIVFDMAAAFDQEQTEQIAREMLSCVNDQYIQFYASRFLMKQSLRNREPNKAGPSGPAAQRWLEAYSAKVMI